MSVCRSRTPTRLLAPLKTWTCCQPWTISRQSSLTSVASPITVITSPWAALVRPRNSVNPRVGGPRSPARLFSVFFRIWRPTQTWNNWTSRTLLSHTFRLTAPRWERGGPTELTEESGVSLTLIFQCFVLMNLAYKSCPCHIEMWCTQKPSQVRKEKDNQVARLSKKQQARQRIRVGEQEWSRACLWKPL